MVESESVNMPMVSICCITYNHENYIKKALDGFLMQKTNFAFEILINDDASTDGTTNIIRSYESKYPDMIKPIYQIENQYSKGIRSIYGFFNFPRAKGKYIAMCEGDDYWIDPNKLQTQVDFLENNEDYGLVHSDLNEYNTITNKTDTTIWKKRGQNKQSGNIYQLMMCTDTISMYMCTSLFRTGFVKDNIAYKNLMKENFLFGDVPLALLISVQSKVAYQNKVTAVRNILSFSETNGRTFEHKIKIEEEKYRIMNYFFKINSSNIDSNYIINNFIIGKLNVCFEYNKKQEFLTQYNKLNINYADWRIRVKKAGIQNLPLRFITRSLIRIARTINV